MRLSSGSFFLILVGLFFGTASFALHAENPKALPLDAPAAIAIPAVMDAVTFNLHFEGDTHTMIVTASPTLLRVDLPADRYSIIYNARTDHYTGLEHSNDTYWEFSWPEVRDQVENSKRAEARLRDLGTEGLSGYQAVDTNAASASDPDAAGYVWHPTNEKKRIAHLDCVRWEGTTVSGETISAWCAPTLLPPVQIALEHLRLINEPMALVPVRPLVPALIFPIYDALTKGGVMPVLILWGDDKEKNQFSFVESKQRDGKATLFEVPKYYMKTTLVTMDGLGNPVKK